MKNFYTWMNYRITKRANVYIIIINKFSSIYKYFKKLPIIICIEFFMSKIHVVSRNSRCNGTLKQVDASCYKYFSASFFSIPNIAVRIFWIIIIRLITNKCNCFEYDEMSNARSLMIRLTIRLSQLIHNANTTVFASE